MRSCDREVMAREIRTAEDPSRRNNHKERDGLLHYGEESVSVAMEEVKSQDWAVKVYNPDIQNKWDKLYRKPGYDVNDL
jgi:hypothetical protein